MLTHSETALRLGLAAALGGAIGFERERLLWAAGLRTHMLVCVGACLMIIVSAYGFGDALQQDHVVLDPSRVAAQVVSGIGFLGAGTILLRGEVVKGLTTAASLWTVAGVGLACGAGMPFAASLSTAIVLLILAGIKPLEERFKSRGALHVIRVQADRGAFTLTRMQQAAGTHASKVQMFVMEPDENSPHDSITLTFARLPRTTVEHLTATFRGLPGVISADMGA